MDIFSDFTMTIDGAPIRSEATIEVINPATEAVLATVPDASRTQLDQAVAAARHAFDGWKKTPLAERQRLVSALADRLEEHHDDFARLLTLEQGKPLHAPGGSVGEIKRSIDWLRAIAQMSPPVETVVDSDTRLRQTRHLPIGVVGAISAWNFPMLLAMMKIPAALVTGNTLIAKPSPFTPLTLLKFGELARDIFPPGVFNVLSGGDDLGPWMTAHLDIDKIAFTGSTATGKAIMRSASVNVKRLVLELGGNDPAIVLDDVAVEHAVPHLFWAAFSNNAQFCLASKRIYVQAGIYDRFAQAFVDYARTVKIGDGLQPDVQIGPVQNKKQFDHLKKLLADSHDAGVNFLLGGGVPTSVGKGYFMPLAIADNPAENSRVVVEEAFGPVVPLLKFDTIEEAVARANNTEYGLGASVWSGDTARAQQVGARMDAGTVWVNTIHELHPHSPFGGHKQSGLGVENGMEGLLEFTNAQTLVINKNPLTTRS